MSESETIIPVHFKSVVLADGENATLGVRFRHADLPLAEAARLLCGAQLAVRMAIGDSEQQTLEGMEDELDGICEVKGFSVNTKAINATLRFNREEVGAEELARYANADGRIAARRVGKAGKGHEDEAIADEHDDSTPLLDAQDDDQAEAGDVSTVDIGLPPEIVAKLLDAEPPLTTLRDLQRVLDEHDGFTHIEAINDEDDEDIRTIMASYNEADSDIAGRITAEADDDEEDQDPEWRDVTIKHVLENAGASLHGLKTLDDCGITNLGDLSYAFQTADDDYGTLAEFLKSLGLSAKTATKIAEAVEQWFSYPHRLPGPSWTNDESSLASADA